mmetsp:Transcript_4388/g.6193  ORF Transcript_4388/g.6193 Transcript_4388/m.6193 type:complete len:81 (+) Transcript_4388:111-353(+)
MSAFSTDSEVLCTRSSVEAWEHTVHPPSIYPGVSQVDDATHRVHSVMRALQLVDTLPAIIFPGHLPNCDGEVGGTWEVAL